MPLPARAGRGPSKAPVRPTSSWRSSVRRRGATRRRTHPRASRMDTGERRSDAPGLEEHRPARPIRPSVLPVPRPNS